MRYIIGIDLGTTNCCVSYVDTENSKQAIHPFRIPQLIASGYTEGRSALPSFCYLAAPHEWPSGTLDLPWRSHQAYFVGHFAQEQGARAPTRLVQSAKSWLCHSAANRRDKILPIEASDRTICISPVEATAAYLRHIKDAWNHLMAKDDPAAEFEAQDIVLTVPASFDEVARTLTAEAAKQAGFANITLLEEPQAAFYSWLSTHEEIWEKQLHEGDRILVCDVGGGTTDFSLMNVVVQEGKLTIQRMAVGDHLLLGGDNMDAALAIVLEEKLREQGLKEELSSTQLLQLRFHSRCAKEKLLTHANTTEDSDSYQVVLQGAGSSVVSGSMSATITRPEVEKILIDGFFGQYDWKDAIQLRKARGLRSMGLPYEDDPSITKHLAYFLSRSNGGNAPNPPNYVLFNGGAMKASGFQSSIVQALRQWFPGEENHIKVLSSASLDFAVGRGAAYYGKVRRGLGVPIRGGTARGYYLGLEVKGPSGQEMQALTLLPRGCDEDYVYESDQTFWLTPNTPIAFHLYTSHVRLHDRPGELVGIDSNELQLLPPIHTVLRFGKQQQFYEGTQEKLRVKLGIRLTAIGTLEIWLKSQITDHRWPLEFQLRNAAGQDNSIANLENVRNDETFDTNFLEASKIALKNLFSGNDAVQISPKMIMEHLEKLLERPRKDWPLSVCRSLADVVLQQAGQRKRTQEHESRWWNLIGFLMRPGFAYPLDDFRIKELWKVILGDIKAPKLLENQIQHWICYRRVAGGLNKGQQTQIFNEMLPFVLSKKSGKIEVKGKSDVYAYSEKIRVIGALELIDVSLKTKIGNLLLKRIISKEACEADYWALGRLGARHLLYGSVAHVVSKETCEKWVRLLLGAQSGKDQIAMLIAQLARKTDQIQLKVSQKLVDEILVCYEGSLEYEHLQKVLNQVSDLTLQEQEHSFGDRLPIGLTLYT